MPRLNTQNLRKSELYATYINFAGWFNTSHYQLTQSMSLLKLTSNQLNQFAANVYRHFVSFFVKFNTGSILVQYYQLNWFNTLVQYPYLKVWGIGIEPVGTY